MNAAIANRCRRETACSVSSLRMEAFLRSASWTNPVVSSFLKYFKGRKSDEQSVPLKSMSILGINYCTASLGLEIAAQMAPGEVVTVTGAAGGTGLAATELSLSYHHPVVVKT